MVAKTIAIKGAIISNDEKEIYDMFGIESTCPNDVRKALENAKGKPITTEINSGGGSVLAGSEINALLSSYDGDVIQNIIFAASAASVIAMAGKAYIYPTGLMMIHNVSTTVQGDHNDMKHMAETLETINESVANAYVKKTGKTMEEALELMEKETWFSSTAALENGLVDGIVSEKAQQSIQIAASYGTTLLPESVIAKARQDRFDNKKKTAEAQLELLKLKNKKGGH